MDGMEKMIIFDYIYWYKAMIIIFIILVVTISTLKPALLNQTTFNEFSKNMDNIHHYIIHSKYVSSDLE